VQSSRIATAITRWVIAVVLLALLLSPAAMQMMTTRDMALRGARKPAASAKAKFTVRGRVKGLYPGARKPLTLKIKNPQRYPLKVKELKVKVRKSNKRGCKRNWLKPRRKVRVSLLVPARAKARVSYPVKMKKRAPNACQGVRWKLKFTGKAVRAR
jgi:hypothetical protein